MNAQTTKQNLDEYVACLRKKAQEDLVTINNTLATLREIRDIQIEQKSGLCANLIPALIAITDACPQATDCLIAPMIKAATHAHRHLVCVLENTKSWK